MGSFVQLKWRAPELWNLVQLKWPAPELRNLGNQGGRSQRIPSYLLKPSTGSSLLKTKRTLQGSESPTTAYGPKQPPKTSRSKRFSPFTKISTPGLNSLSAIVWCAMR